MKNKKLISFIKVAVLTITLGVTSISSLAATTTPDPTSARSLTIHAIQSNTGTVQADFSIEGATPLKNITFEVMKILPTNGLSEVDMVAHDPSTYIADMSKVYNQSITSDLNGIAHFPIASDDSMDGYYLVNQRTPINGEISMAPFIAQIPFNDTNWMYALDVYPKLDASSSLKTQVFVGDQDGTLKQEAVTPGAQVTFTYPSSLPASMINGTSVDANAYYTITCGFDNMLTNPSLVSLKVLREDGTETGNRFSNIAKLNFVVDNNKWTLTLKGSDILTAMSGFIEGDQIVPEVSYLVDANAQYGALTTWANIKAMNSYGLLLTSETITEPEFTGLDPNNQAAFAYVGAVKIKLTDPIAHKSLEGVGFDLYNGNTKVGTAITDQKGEMLFSGLLLLDTIETTGLADTLYSLRYQEATLPVGYSMPRSIDVTGYIDPILAASDPTKGDQVINITIDPEQVPDITDPDTGAKIPNLSFKLPMTGGVLNMSNWFVAALCFVSGIMLLGYMRRRDDQ